MVSALALPSPAAAQYSAQPIESRAIGETYHVEISAGLWNPTPEIFVSSRALDIVGTDIDAVNDLGVIQRKFGEFSLTLRPWKQHKFRFHYLPMRYEASSTISRDLVFNGTTYQLGLPVSSVLDWKSYQFAYEYDFIYRDRGFVGVVLQTKYTDVQVQLDSAVGSEFTRARGPLPSVGGIGRGYVTSNVSITGEATLFRLPAGIHEGYQGEYLDYNVYGTVNITDHFGTQVGYRSVDVNYQVDRDTGSLQMRGLYFSGVVRF